jgi:NAD(P)-dependent dehydrogenase (short-subunit alcohol dehydrogenase family)
MSASNFYSVIAGVGAGTGIYSLSLLELHTLTHISAGRSVALKFAKTYAVALLARNPANYESIVEEIKAAGGQAIGISTDVSSESAIKGAFEEIQKEFKGKKLAAAVYNVGGGFVRKPFLEMTLAEYEGGYKSNGYALSV